MKRTGTLLLLAFVGALPAAYAQSGKWPERPVRVIVPFPPGGSPDVVARLLTPQLSEEFGQQFVVDNRADGREPAHSTPEEFARVLARDIATWSKVVRNGNIKIE